MERRNQLAFFQKTVAPNGAMPVGAKQFDGDLLLNLAVGTLRQVDATHSAASDDRNDTVRADNIAGRNFAVSLQGVCNALDGFFEIEFGAGGVSE